MAERLINSESESKEAIAAEIAALPEDVRALVDVLKSESVGYPAMFFYMQSGSRETYACIDAKLLVTVSGGSKDDLKDFIVSELLAHLEGIVMELVNG